MLNVGSPLVAQAELIGTLQAVEAGTRAPDRAGCPPDPAPANSPP